MINVGDFRMIIYKGCGGAFLPSDMGLAVGTALVLQTVNNCVAVFDKSGVLQPGFPKSLNDFLGLGPAKLILTHARALTGSTSVTS